MLNFNVLEKDLGLVFPPHFQEKSFSCYILLPDQIHYLIAFAFRDIRQYEYCNCLLTRL